MLGEVEGEGGLSAEDGEASSKVGEAVRSGERD